MLNLCLSMVALGHLSILKSTLKLVDLTQGEAGGELLVAAITCRQKVIFQFLLEQKELHNSNPHYCLMTATACDDTAYLDLLSTHPSITTELWEKHFFFWLQRTHKKPQFGPIYIENKFCTPKMKSVYEMYMAASLGDVGVFKQHLDLTAFDNEERKAVGCLEIAVERGYLAVVQVILDPNPVQDRTSLDGICCTLAIKQGQVEILRWLFEKYGYHLSKGTIRRYLEDSRSLQPEMITYLRSLL